MSEEMDPAAVLDTCELNGQEDELERLAVEELVKEAKRAKERSHTLGSYGWAKRKVTTNKRFLHSTLVSTLREYRTGAKQHRRSSTLEVKDDQRRSTSALDTIINKPDLISTTLNEKGNNSEKTSSALSSQSGRSNCKDADQDAHSHRKDDKAGKPRNYHDHRFERKGKQEKRSRSCSEPREENNQHRAREHDRTKKKSKHKKKHKHDDRHSRSSSSSHKSTRRHKE